MIHPNQNQRTPEERTAYSKVKRLKAAERIRSVYRALLSDEDGERVYCVESLESRKYPTGWVYTWQPYFITRQRNMTTAEALEFLSAKSASVRLTDATARHPPEVIRRFALYNLRTDTRMIL